MLCNSMATECPLSTRRICNRLRSVSSEPFLSCLSQAAYQSLLALLLALLEIEIEGAHGWAEKLPTWRWGPPWYLRLTNGKPMTGYHASLLSLILLFLHGPLLDGFSWEREARVLSVFFQLAVVWDFLWFVLNPAYGTPRFKPGQVAWFRSWIGPAPADYYGGLSLSLLLGAVSGEFRGPRAAELALQAPVVLAALGWAASRRR